MGDLATPCDVLDEWTSAADIEEIFDREPGRESVAVRTQGRDCVLVSRGAFYQRLTGRLGYGYSLHRRRPVRDMEMETAPSFPHSTPIIEAGLDLIQREAIGRSPVLLVEGPGAQVATISTQQVFAHLGRTFHQKVGALETSDRRFRSMLANANEVICLIGPDGRTQWVSDTVRAVLGVDPHNVLGAHIADRVIPSDQAGVRAMLDTVASGERRHVNGDASTTTANGDVRIVEFHATNLLHDPAVAAIVVNIRDVTERRRLEARLIHDARHDSLTGLPNRAMLGELLDQHLSEVSRRVAVAFVDLDGFKEVNDTLGHGSGDTVLKTVAASIRGVIRAGDLVARLGGDEFAVLMHDDGDDDLRDVVPHVVERVLRAVSQPVAVAGERIVTGASIGVAFGDDTTDADQLLQRADVAMYRAKASGRHRACWWDRGMHETVIDRHLMARELGEAAGKGHLRLLYQPLVDLPGARISGYEALLRWHRPGHGTLAPGAFIGVAEETMAIVEIGRWVLREACEQAAAWSGEVGGPTMSVNLSAHHFRTDDVVVHVRDALARSGLPPHRLEVEVTETAMMQCLEEVGPRIEAVRDLGVRIAIDDFGVGYSSLAQLRGLPVDCVKIDRSFVSTLGTSEGDRALVTGIIGLARALQLTVVAEGVETGAQAAIDDELGCERAQGFFYGKPQAALEADPGQGHDGGALLPAAVG